MTLRFHPTATFRGLRHVPLVAVSHNSLFPALQIGEEGLTIRIIRRHRLAFRDIAEIDLVWRLAHQVTIVPKTGPWTFCANFLARDGARQLLAALDARALRLTPRARRLLEGAPPRQGLE